MCGIFGVIGKPNPYALRALAIANRERGTDSLGFFKSNGHLAKRACDPLKALAALNGFIEDPKAWFIVGHTRYATRGKVSNRNAHPFRRGRIVGVHNGVVSAPSEYAVDSEYLIDSLNTKGNYQTALEDISGYWALAWFDGADLYIGCHENSVAIARTKDAVYFSSDAKHLAAVIKADITTIASGRVIRFDMKLAARRKWADCPDFVSNARPVKKDWRTSGKGWKKWSTSSTDSDYYEQDERSGIWRKTESTNLIECTDTRLEDDDFKDTPSFEDWHYLEGLAYRCGFSSADEAMNHYGLFDPQDTIEELEAEIADAFARGGNDDENIRRKGQRPE